MIFLVIGLVLVILVLLGIIMHDRKQRRGIEKQLAFVREQFSLAPIKSVGGDKRYRELIQKINQLLFDYRDMQQKYQNADQHNRMMIASIAHDFRTPLTSISGYVQLLKEEPEGEDAEKYYQVILQRIHSLSLLIEDFYAISILQSNEYPVRLQPVQPLLILQEELALYYAELQAHFANLSIGIEENRVECRSDPMILKRIIQNLIKNALIHGTQMFSVQAALVDQGIQVIIRNGIDPLKPFDITRIFDRMYIGDQSRHQRSTGLGLAIVRELCRLLRISIQAEIVEEQLSLCLVIPENEAKVT